MQNRLKRRIIFTTVINFRRLDEKMEATLPPWLQNHGRQTGGTGGIPTNYSQAKIELSLFDLEKDIQESKA